MEEDPRFVLDVRDGHCTLASSTFSKSRSRTSRLRCNAAGSCSNNDRAINDASFFKGLGGSRLFRWVESSSSEKQDARQRQNDRLRLYHSKRSRSRSLLDESAVAANRHEEDTNLDDDTDERKGEDQLGNPLLSPNIQSSGPFPFPLTDVLPFSPQTSSGPMTTSLTDAPSPLSTSFSSTRVHSVTASSSLSTRTSSSATSVSTTTAAAAALSVASNTFQTSQPGFGNRPESHKDISYDRTGTEVAVATSLLLGVAFFIILISFAYHRRGHIRESFRRMRHRQKFRDSTFTDAAFISNPLMKPDMASHNGLMFEVNPINWDPESPFARPMAPPTILSPRPKPRTMSMIRHLIAAPLTPSPVTRYSWMSNPFRRTPEPDPMLSTKINQTDLDRHASWPSSNYKDALTIQRQDQRGYSDHNVNGGRRSAHTASSARLVSEPPNLATRYHRSRSSHRTDTHPIARPPRLLEIPFFSWGSSSTPAAPDALSTPRMPHTPRTPKIAGNGSQDSSPSRRKRNTIMTNTTDSAETPRHRSVRSWVIHQQLRGENREDGKRDRLGREAARWQIERQPSPAIPLGDGVDTEAVPAIPPPLPPKSPNPRTSNAAWFASEPSNPFQSPSDPTSPNPLPNLSNLNILSQNKPHPREEGLEIQDDLAERSYKDRRAHRRLASESAKTNRATLSVFREHPGEKWDWRNGRG